MLEFWDNTMALSRATLVRRLPALMRVSMRSAGSEATMAKRILDHLALDSTGPPVARAQPHEELLEPGPDYGAADPVYPE
jgi:hypothetical protein